MKQPVKTLVPLCLALFIFACGHDQQKDDKQDKSRGSADVVSEENAMEKTHEQGDYYFSGLIDHKYAISLHLQLNPRNATGTYYYHSQRKELRLVGSWEHDLAVENRSKGWKRRRLFEADEKVNDKITGHFSGTGYSTDSVSGKWKSPKGKELDFVLYRSDAAKYAKYIKEQAPQKFDLQALKAFRTKFKTVSFPFEYEPLDEETGKAFTDAEIRTYSMNDYDSETYSGYRYYYGVTYETDEYTAFLFTEDYYPGAFGIHNLSLVILTIGKTGDLVDKKYLGCHCMDTNMGSNDYYATDDSFFFTDGNIRIESVYTHATLIEDESEGGPFKETDQKTKNVSIDASGKIGDTGF